MGGKLRSSGRGAAAARNIFSGPALQQVPHRPRINQVLVAQDARGQRAGVVAGQHRHHRLGDDGAVVKLSRHPMHAGAGDLAAGVQGALVRVQAGKSRQQRGVNIEQPPGVMGHKSRAQDAHEARQQHQRGLVAVNGLDECRIKGRPGLKLLVRKRSCGNAHALGKRQAVGIRLVAEHADHAGIEFFKPALFLRGMDDGFHVGALARDQNNDVFYTAMHTSKFMTIRILTPIEARVLATLMEKARTVPDSYPLSLNALVLGCNQKTSREPLMEIGDDEARDALASLKAQSLVFEASSSRVPRFEHNFQRAAGVNEAQAVVLGLLTLRGPQTPAELRTNAERWYKFADAAALEAVLTELQQRGDDGGQAMVQKLPRAANAREQRWTHLLCGEPDLQALMAHGPTASESSDLLARVTALENTIARLKADNAQLREHILSISQQLGIVLADAADLSRP